MAEAAVAHPAWVLLAYLVAGVCFILALRGLSGPESSRRGNYIGMVGMAIAVGTTLATHGLATIAEILGAMVVGGTIDSAGTRHGDGAMILFDAGEDATLTATGEARVMLLGGAPAVWNGCMVFFQVCLLIGYAYAHFSTRWLTPKPQAAVHLLLLILVQVDPRLFENKGLKLRIVRRLGERFARFCRRLRRRTTPCHDASSV